MRKMKQEIHNLFVRWSMESEDDFWNIYGQSDGMYPPSFYATHTEDEIQEIYRQDIDRLRQMAQKYDLEMSEEGQLHNKKE